MKSTKHIGKRIHLLDCIMLIFVISILICGCGDTSEKVKQIDEKKPAVKEDNRIQKKEPETMAEYPVSEDYINHHPENLRSVSDGERIFAFGDRGIYVINEEGWNLLYQGEGIKAMDLYNDYLYFLQTDPQQNTILLHKMNLDGSGGETLQTDYNIVSALHIYEHILYYYSDNMILRGFELGEDGTIKREVDISNSDYVYKEQNEAQQGKAEYKEGVIDPGYSRQYYNGIFNYQPNNELYRKLVFESNGKTEELIAALRDVPLIVGNKIYYTMFDDDVGMYYYDMNSKKSAIYEIGPCSGTAFLNYDERYVYYTDHYPLLQEEEKTIRQLDTQTGMTKELYNITLGQITYTNSFDVCGRWILYRDYTSGNLQLRETDQIDHIVQEP